MSPKIESYISLIFSFGSSIPPGIKPELTILTYIILSENLNFRVMI